jgi:hypothetical protein
MTHKELPGLHCLLHRGDVCCQLYSDKAAALPRRILLLLNHPLHTWYAAQLNHVQL